MAERLTEKIVKTVQDKYSLGQYLYYDFAGLDDTNKLLNKLGKLEDILEKYDIESIEMLEQELKIAREIERLKNKKFDLSNSAIVDKDFYKDFTREIEKLETDRDTWKRACKDACKKINIVQIITNEEMLKYEDNLEDYFYQQAKTEGNDE